MADENLYQVFNLMEKRFKLYFNKLQSRKLFPPASWEILIEINFFPPQLLSSRKLKKDDYQLIKKKKKKINERRGGGDIYGPQGRDIK